VDKELNPDTQSAPKPPAAGVIYGEICYWLVMVGIVIAIVGMIMYFVSDGNMDKQCLLDGLWDGHEVETIWETCTEEGHVPEGHWYLSALSKGDVVAMLGIAITGFAAVVGMWGALVGTVRSGERLYSLFAVIVAVILTASAVGVVSIH
jgi:hypothetical protein